MTPPETTASSSTPYAAPSKTAKLRFLDSYEREHACTLKVLKAFPADQAGFRPHERSSSALQLAWTFVVEGQLALRTLRGEDVLAGGFPPAPDSWDTVVDTFTKQYDELAGYLRDPQNADLTHTVTFFVAPKQMAPIPAADFLWFMLHDQIHHRGQLSVYLRMAGGKVPSIYGPSADEPWF